MPGDPAAMPKLINCSPSPNNWKGTEVEKAQDNDPAKAVAAALNKAKTAARGLALNFVAQDCTGPDANKPTCTNKDHPDQPTLIPGIITVAPDQPPDKDHKGLKGPFWEATSTVSWTIWVQCYGTPKARDDAKAARIAAEKKAKEDEEKKK